MPLFANKPAGDAAGWEPQAADGRLAHTAGADPAGVFTSDLSVSEYVLLGEAGFEPLGFVVGSSIYHIGLHVGRWNQKTPLQVLTHATYNARELAMVRMRAEADHLAADGIVGVQLRMQMYAWGQHCLEFVATGTAVRHLAGQGAHQGVMQSLRQAGQNQEMLQFTQGVYEARELALTRMQVEAATARSSGIVGVSV